jgi:hypothetical protein
MWMAGYGARSRPSEGVLHELHAKALALQDERNTTAVIVTADILGSSREMADSIASGAKERFGLPRQRLLLSASHTHSGPVTGYVLRPAYPLDQAQIAIVSRYTAGLLDQIVNLIGASMANLEVWQVGGLTLIAMGGEVAADYALRFKARYGWDMSWVAAYTNDVFAYIPSVRVLKEGGYEGGGAMVPYGQPAPFQAA